MSKFSAQHYNAIAADIRTELTSAVAFYAPRFNNLKSGSTQHYYAVDALVKLVVLMTLDSLTFARNSAIL